MLLLFAPVLLDRWSISNATWLKIKAVFPSRKLKLELEQVNEGDRYAKRLMRLQHIEIVNSPRAVVETACCGNVGKQKCFLIAALAKSIYGLWKYDNNVGLYTRLVQLVGVWCGIVLVRPPAATVRRTWNRHGSSHFIFKAQADVSENAIAKYNTVHYLYPSAPQKEIS